MIGSKCINWAWPDVIRRWLAKASAQTAVLCLVIRLSLQMESWRGNDHSKSLSTLKKAEGFIGAPASSFLTARNERCKWASCGQFEMQPGGVVVTPGVVPLQRTSVRQRCFEFWMEEARTIHIDWILSLVWEASCFSTGHKTVTYCTLVPSAKS